MFRTCLRSAALAVPAAFLLALLATPSSAIQRNVTIYQIQDTTSVGHVVEGSTDTVTTSGIVTGADTRPTGFGFYIQDPGGGFFSGTQVFTGGANVFADSGYARGDIIQATGRVNEFGGDKLYQTYAANEPNPEVADPSAPERPRGDAPRATRRAGDRVARRVNVVAHTDRTS